MPKPKADLAAYEATVIASAIEFTATIFAGPGKYETTRHTSLEDARRSAQALTKQAVNGRTAIVYAISLEGRQVLVPASYQPANTAKSKEPSMIKVASSAKSATKTAKAKKKAAKPAKTPKTTPPSGKRAAILAAAQAGKLPEPPDFSANTHERFRGKLEKIVAMAKAGDIKGLKAIEINPVSSSPKAMAKYRDLCVIALEAKKAA